MAVDDHGLETIRKAGEEVVPGSKADYYIKVAGTDAAGAEPIAVTGNFAAAPEGLAAGLFTEVTLSDSAWTALPPTALTDRQCVSIQNTSTAQIKINFATPAGYVGVVVEATSERQYNLKDSGVIYAKAEPGSGSPVVGVEELKS
jgi:hypothetical protein